MVDLETLAKEGLKFKDRKILDRFGCTVFDWDGGLIPFGWGNPKTEYKFTNYNYREYSIEKATQYDEWYLKKGAYTVCELRHLGGENWETIWP